MKRSKGRESEAKVAILMGSDSDWPIMSTAATRLDALGIENEAHVMSAHRSPEATARFARGAREAGFRVIICGAGAAAHLAGAVSAQTTLPVIGVPLEAGGLGGLDALLATVQMPAGIPVATVAIGKSGADNAALLAAQILALADPALAARLDELKAGLARGVEEKDQRLQRERRASKEGSASAASSGAAASGPTGGRRTASGDSRRAGSRAGRTARGQA